MYVVNYSGVDSEFEKRMEIRQKRGDCSAVVTKIPTGRCFRCDSIKTLLATSENIFCISSSGSVR